MACILPVLPGHESDADSTGTTAPGCPDTEIIEVDDVEGIAVEDVVSATSPMPAHVEAEGRSRGAVVEVDDLDGVAVADVAPARSTMPEDIEAECRASDVVVEVDDVEGVAVEVAVLGSGAALGDVCPSATPLLAPTQEFGSDSQWEFAYTNGSEMGPMEGDTPPPPWLPPSRRCSRSRSRSSSRALASTRGGLAAVLSPGRFGGVALSRGGSQVGEAFDFCRRRLDNIASRGAAFYIGITENPARRWEQHASDGLWSHLQVLVEGPHSGITSCLERRLVERFRDRLMCQNVGPGGECASAGRPHYLYVLVGLSGLIRRRR